MTLKECSGKNQVTMFIFLKKAATFLLTHFHSKSKFNLILKVFSQYGFDAWCLLKNKFTVLQDSMVVLSKVCYFSQSKQCFRTYKCKGERGQGVAQAGNHSLLSAGRASEFRSKLSVHASKEAWAEQAGSFY